MVGNWRVGGLILWSDREICQDVRRVSRGGVGIKEKDISVTTDNKVISFF